MLLEHCRDPLVLPSLPNFALVHRNDRTTTPVSSSFRHRSASPSSRRSTGPQPQPRAPAAPHHPIEASQQLLHRPPAPQPQEHHAAIAAGETRATSTSTTPFHPNSSRTRYRNSIPTTPRCLCALHPSMFIGPSLGTRTRRHGHRHSSPSTLLCHLSLCPPPTNVCTSSYISYRTSFPSAKPSPPARTRRPDTTTAVLTRQGPHCNLGFHVRVPYAKTRGPLYKFSFSVVCKSCQLVNLIEICRKIQKWSNQFCYTPEVYLYNFD
jgi:hypothetical protein